MNALLVVYDVMVFLQAAVNPHRRHATFAAIEDKRLSLCTSLELLAEVRDVLTRPVMAAKFPMLTPQRVTQFIDGVTSLAKFSPAPSNVFTWPQHPDDDHLFNLAIHAQAKYLVTWETRILNLATQASPAADALRQLTPALEIVTPKRLAEILQHLPKS